ncbi:MAG: hypothetical protein RXP77_03160 [Nitrososphaeria archaeon]
MDADACFACGACVAACRLATGGDAWIWVLQLESEEESRPVWIPYVCSQVGPPACSFEGRPPCELACPSGAISRSGPGGAPEGAIPLPSRRPGAGAYLRGRVPRDVARSLPDPASVIPRRGGREPSPQLM